MPITSLLSDEVKTWIKKSMASELYASNLYKHIANKMQRIGMFGAQAYFLNESADELTHYQKLVDYVNDMGDIIDVPSVDEISDSVSSIKTALDIAMEAEMSLLNQYKEFYEKAEDDLEDCVTATFLLEFITIQRKSVGEYGDLIARYEQNPTDVFEFDEYLKELSNA